MRRQIRYVVSSILWFFFNPFGFWQGVAQVLGQAVATVNAFIFKSILKSDPVPMSLPFKGCWTVVKGGITKVDSHSWSIIAQRYAYDFYVTDNDNKSHKGSGKDLEDYYAFGKPVIAPADGVVVEVRDDIRDFPHSGTGWIDWRSPDLRGNYVIICHDRYLYSLIAHLKQGSCKVKKGDRVQRGQIIGECGNSGVSTEPHIHFHLQHHPNFFLSVGMPILFMNFKLQEPGTDNFAKRSLGYISKGHKVANLQDEQDITLPDKETVPLVDTSVSFWDVVSSLLQATMTLLGIVGILRIFVVGIQLALQVVLAI